MHPSSLAGQHPRLEPSRSATWPLSAPTPTRVETDDAKLLKSHSTPSLAMFTTTITPAPRRTAKPSKPANDPFEDDLNQHPEDHFLSPIQMYEFEDWAADSDDEDDEEYEWDAGITDFALFDSDRRQAEQRQEQLPDRWQGFVASQASALQRAVERNRTDNSHSQHSRSWTPLAEDVPQLTPDNSPDLRGDLQIHGYCGGQKTLPVLQMPSFPGIKITPPPQDEEDEDFDDDDDEYSDEDEDDDLPVAYLVERARERRRVSRQLERPGMRFSRTLSGKVHVWRRPSLQIYDVDEDVAAESRAEKEVQKGDEVRGRR